jgi:threonylcarbamoyladenosine tRNA methylthiotransferase MtaB
MFDNTLRIVEEADLTFLHVFPFSPRPGTPAARMPQVPRRLARQRAAALRARSAAKFTAFCASRVGVIESVLVERQGLGRTEQFVPVRLSDVPPGEIVNLEIVGADASGLVGVPLRKAA